MRGTDEASGSRFIYVDLEERIPAPHPLRKIRQVVNDALTSLTAAFDAIYVDFGRPSIAPERLIRASLIQILFSIRSERQLMEQMQYNLLFRWFVGLGIDDPVWVPTVFTKTRDRLLNTEMPRKVMAAILTHRAVKPLLSDDHFSVDGTPVKAWASMKSFRPRVEGSQGDDDPGDPPTPDTAANAPHQTLPPQCRGRLQRREALECAPRLDDESGRTALQEGTRRKPRCASSVEEGQKTVRGTVFSTTGLIENRSGLIVEADLARATGRAKRQAAIDVIHRHSPGSTRRRTLGADKGYDAAEFVADLRQACVTPHIAQKSRHSAINARITRHKGYDLSLRHSKRIEEAFGWAKTIGGAAQTAFRGIERARARFIMTPAAGNLARLPKLLAA